MAAIIVLGLVSVPGYAHHGGLGIEGDVVAWSLKVDQWQQERLVQGYRVKFLAYPWNVVAQGSTRLVFEVQAVASGRYVGRLTATAVIRSPNGDSQEFAAAEEPGVTAYYELAHTFPRAGDYSVTFHAPVNDQEISATFSQTVAANPLFGDWATLLGNGVVLAAFLVTWVGVVVALQRRFLPDLAALRSDNRGGARQGP